MATEETKPALNDHMAYGIFVVLAVVIAAPWGGKWKAAKESREVPNALTQLRLLLVGVYAFFVVLYPLTSNTVFLWLAIVALVVAYVTDWFDGHWSRKWGHTSQYGVLHDPLADKAITNTAVLSSAILGYFWFPGDKAWQWTGTVFWITMLAVIILRDWRVTRLRNRYLASGNKGSVAADKTGKYKTACIMVGTAMCLVAVALSLPPLTWIGSALMFAGCILSAYSWLAVYEKAYRII